MQLSLERYKKVVDYTDREPSVGASLLRSRKGSGLNKRWRSVLSRENGPFERG